MKYCVLVSSLFGVIKHYFHFNKSDHNFDFCAEDMNFCTYSKSWNALSIYFGETLEYSGAKRTMSMKFFFITFGQGFIIFQQIRNDTVATIISVFRNSSCTFKVAALLAGLFKLVASACPSD